MMDRGSYIFLAGREIKIIYDLMLSLSSLVQIISFVFKVFVRNIQTKGQIQIGMFQLFLQLLFFLLGICMEQFLLMH